jgi:FKBP-type peptidyl-prolyl cis-trans isomerase FkpA
MRIVLLLLFLVAFIAGCKKNITSTEQAKIDNDIILKYIAENNLNATATGSGLYYVIDELGTGDGCNANSSVKVAYKGYFTDGNIFDQSAASGVTFSLKQVIQGWTEGIPYFKEGGHGILLVPSALGYGTDGNSGIPENSVLIFDVELIEVL